MEQSGWSAVSGFWCWKCHQWRWLLLRKGHLPMPRVICCWGGRVLTSPWPSWVSALRLKGSSGMAWGHCRRWRGTFECRTARVWEIPITQGQTPVLMDGGGSGWTPLHCCCAQHLFSKAEGSWFRNQAIFHGNWCLVTSSAVLVYSGSYSNATGLFLSVTVIRHSGFESHIWETISQLLAERGGWLKLSTKKGSSKGFATWATPVIVAPISAPGQAWLRHPEQQSKVCTSFLLFAGLVWLWLPPLAVTWLW